MKVSARYGTIGEFEIKKFAPLPVHDQISSLLLRGKNKDNMIHSKTSTHIRRNHTKYYVVVSSGLKGT